MAMLSDRFTVIAPDNPGNGLSDPLPVGRREIEDYAEALAGFLDCMGVKRCLIYGFHTGASITLALASRYPDRVAHAILNGITVSTPDEAAEFSDMYSPPFTPQWDGSHLCWLWARLREQTIFFPWYRPDDAGRLPFTPPSAAALTEGVLDMLRAGESYPHAYGAAFRAPTQAHFRALICPTTLIQAAWDPLAPHMERLVTLPDCVNRVRLGHGREEYLAPLLAALVNAMGSADQALTPPPQSPTRCFSAGLHIRLNPGRGRPLVILHDHAEDGHETVAGSHAGPERAWISFDLPGHGESAEPWSDVATSSELVLRALDNLGVEDFEIIGNGLGYKIAQAIVDKDFPGKHVPNKNVRGVLSPNAQPARLSQAQWHAGAELLAKWSETNDHGAHLLAAWRLARDRALFDPWCVPGPETARRPHRSLEPAVIHRAAISAFIARPVWSSTWNCLRPD
jgi:pimeloyl-ACP methyl ester carboxylesterase